MQPPAPPAASRPGPAIAQVSTNQANYPGRQVPRRAKLEITFQVSTRASNPFLPFDPHPPPGVPPGQGVSVDGLFTPDGWKTVYTQPAFYMQDFQDQVRDGKEWYYPTSDFAWKVRFSPDRPGSWQFKLRVQDAGGQAETPPQPFSVAASASPGFVRVSKADPRYFELENGAYFPALGYNMNYDHVSWTNPVLDNQADFQDMASDGIQLVRIWLSQWGIYGSAWNAWNSPDPAKHGQIIPYSGLTFEQAYPGSELSLKLDSTRNPCMFVGMWKARPAVKPHTTYRIQVRYKLAAVTGPRQPGLPYGLVAKTGGWLWSPGDYCYDPGAGQVVTTYSHGTTGDWQILQGELTTGGEAFLPNFYLSLENTLSGAAYVDSVWIEEDLGGGEYGANLLSSGWMAHHLYVDQRNAFAFDRLLDLAGRTGVYLRPVVMEKNDWIFDHIDLAGQPIPDDPACKDSAALRPPKCPSSAWFYGSGRQVTKVRWLQQAWWRYLQARWGYSSSIHSWELINEGDPNSEDLYALADEFGAYMHQFRPDDHLVSTSFWHSFPLLRFWANPAYPNLDFADVHQYVSPPDPGFADTALATYELSMRLGALQPGGAAKPVMRGEAGFISSPSGPPADSITRDTGGLWLHNFIWGGINPGGLIESYWYENVHIYRRSRDGALLFDHRDQFRPYYNFIQTIPLNNGHYQDAAARVAGAGLRAWGQVDLLHSQAHLWIQNTAHNWQNALAGQSPPPASGGVTLSGFPPGQRLALEWWDPYQPDPARQILRRQGLVVDPDGSLTIPIDRLASDIAVKIYPQP